MIRDERRRLAGYWAGAVHRRRCDALLGRSTYWWFPWGSRQLASSTKCHPSEVVMRKNAKIWCGRLLTVRLIPCGSLWVVWSIIFRLILGLRWGCILFMAGPSMRRGRWLSWGRALLPCEAVSSFARSASCGFSFWTTSVWPGIAVDAWIYINFHACRHYTYGSIVDGWRVGREREFIDFIDNM